MKLFFKINKLLRIMKLDYEFLKTHFFEQKPLFRSFSILL